MENTNCCTDDPKQRKEIIKEPMFSPKINKKVEFSQSGLPLFGESEELKDPEETPNLLKTVPEAC